jgi:hypothetical protein
METIKNVMQLFVAPNQSPTAGLEGNTISSINDLLDGELCITDEKNVVLDGSTTITASKFKLIKRDGDKLIHSDIIEEGKVKNCTITLPSLETQQVDYIGYNGSAGALDTTVSNLFTIRLYKREWTIAGFMQQSIKEGFYKSAASTSQGAIALGLVDSLRANYSREPEQDIVFDRVNAGTHVALGTSVNTVTFTKGSKYFTATDIDDDTGAGTALAVGNAIVVPRYTRNVTLAGSSGTTIITANGISATATYGTSLTATAAAWVAANYHTYLAAGIKVSSAAAVITLEGINGTSITSLSITNATMTSVLSKSSNTNATGSVYLITALDTTNNIGTLDQAFDGETSTFDDLELSQIDTLGNYGIMIRGAHRAFEAGKFASLPTSFKTIIDFGAGASATVTESVAASPGQGNYQQLAKLEKELQADEYVFRSFVEGAPVDRTNILKNLTYDVISIEYFGSIDSGLGVEVRSPKQLMIALAGNTAIGDDANTGIVTTLNQLFGTDWAVSGFASMTPTA